MTILSKLNLTDKTRSAMLTKKFYWEIRAAVV